MPPKKKRLTSSGSKKENKPPKTANSKISKHNCTVKLSKKSLEEDWSSLLDRPQSTLIRWPQPYKPEVPNKWAKLKCSERARSLAMGGNLYTAPGVCPTCAGFPNQGDILFNQLAGEVHRRLPSTSSSSSSSSSSSLNKSPNYTCTRFDGTKIYLSKEKPNPGYFRHLSFGTKRKQNMISSSNKSKNKTSAYCIDDEAYLNSQQRDIRRIRYYNNELKKTGKCAVNPWLIAGDIKARAREFNFCRQQEIREDTLNELTDTLKNTKLNTNSPKRKSIHKIYTGKRGGKYNIKNGKKKYL